MAVQDVEPLLKKEWFSKNELRLPSQIDVLTEANLKFLLEYLLEEEGYKTEVRLDRSSKTIIDLCNPEGKGIECKKSFYNFSLDELKKYFKYLSFVSLAAFSLDKDESFMFEYALDSLKSQIENRDSKKSHISKIEFSETSHSRIGKNFEEVINAQKERNHREELEKYWEILAKNYNEKGIENLVDKIGSEYFECMINLGIIIYNPLGKMFKKEISDYPKKKSSHKFSPEPESQIQYQVWKFFKEQDYIVTAESRLPGAVETKIRYVKVRTHRVHTQFGDIWDATRLHTTSIPREYRTEPHKIDLVVLPSSDISKSTPEIIGIECKTDVGRNKKFTGDLMEKISSYYHSGDLSKLYLAVESSSKKRAKKFLFQRKLDSSTNEWLPKIGLIIVEENNVEIVKEAGKIKTKDFTKKIYKLKKCDEGVFDLRIERSLDISF